MLVAELTDRVFARSDQLLWLWNFYVGIVLVALAAAAIVPAVRERKAVRVGLMLAFAFIAYANLESMRWVLLQWNALVEANRDAMQPGPLDKVLAAPHPLWVFPFHLVLDAATLVGIWKLSREKTNA